MSQANLGNQINRLLNNAILALFTQGELVQLTHSAFEEMVKKIRSEEFDDYTLNYPIGYKPDKTPMIGSTSYKKEDLVSRYGELSNNQLALNGTYQLVTIIEAVLGDLLKLVIAKYPEKIGRKRSVKSHMILSCSSIEELHMRTADTILNELSYKSPREFAEECKAFFSVNMLECPSFHRYIEIKATRDIYIHNLGRVNEVYLSKADSHTRARLGETLPIDVNYFLESYEHCIQLIEWLEKRFHETWPSSELEERRETKKAEQSNPVDA